MSESAEKLAREVAVDYDLHCESIDDPDIAKLEEMIAAALKGYGIDRENAALEKAAQIVESGEYYRAEFYGRTIAAAIRALKVEVR